MYQYYIIEIRKYPNGEYEHYVYWAYDEDPDVARRKAESKAYELLKDAALSQTSIHSVTVLSDDGFSIMSKNYRNNVKPTDDTPGHALDQEE